MISVIIMNEKKIASDKLAKKKGSIVSNDEIGSSTNYTTAPSGDSVKSMSSSIENTVNTTSKNVVVPKLGQILNTVSLGVAKYIYNSGPNRKDSKVECDDNLLSGTLGALAATHGAYDESLLLSDEESHPCSIPINKKVPPRKNTKDTKEFLRCEGAPPNIPIRCIQSENYNPPSVQYEETMSVSRRHFFTGGEQPEDDDHSIQVELAPMVINHSDTLSIDRSSLFTFAESGAVQMHLPQDNVRLIMDPHIAPGTLLLVKDWGHGDESASFVKKGSSHHTMISPNYVLTVDDDLYRRVVKEMADSRCPCGIYYCCHETDKKVNIMVAVGILGAIFLFLFITTMIWPVS